MNDQTQDRAAEKIELQLTRLDAAVESLKRAQSNVKRYRASVLETAGEAGAQKAERRMSILESLDGAVEASLRRSELLRRSILKPDLPAEPEVLPEVVLEVVAEVVPEVVPEVIPEPVPQPILEARAEQPASEPRPKRQKVRVVPPPEPVEAAPPTSMSEVVLPEPVPPVTASPEKQAPGKRDFLALSQDEQIDILWELLLGQGALKKEDAVRRAAESLRQSRLGSFEKLRSDSPLIVAIEAALQEGLREGAFDRIRRGTVRAVLYDPKDYTPEDWQRCLLAVLGPEPAGIDETLRAAAEWARDNLGLQYARLRTGGIILTPLRTALDELVDDELVLRQGTTVWQA
jgi:hypothetical protein